MSLRANASFSNIDSNTFLPCCPNDRRCNSMRNCYSLRRFCLAAKKHECYHQRKHYDVRSEFEIVRATKECMNDITFDVETWKTRQY